MRKQLVMPAIGLLVVGLLSGFWMVSAADPAVTVRRATDVHLAKDSHVLRGFCPARTTIAHLSKPPYRHADTPYSCRRCVGDGCGKCGPASRAIDRLLDGRVRRSNTDRPTSGSPSSAPAEGTPRFITTIERIQTDHGRHD